MGPPREVLNFIDGHYRTSAHTFALRDPATHQPASVIHEASREDVADAVDAARSALHGPWGGMSQGDRHALLGALTDEIMRRKDDFIAAEISDSGHPISALSSIEIPRGAGQFRSFADIAASCTGSERFTTPLPGGGNAENSTRRTPKGVIAAICPWNLPLIMASWKAAPALAFGNTVVLKPSEETPSTASMLGEAVNAVGFPPGVFNVVNGFGPGSAGEHLVTHPDVDAISFTGETVTGTAIMQAAAVGLRDVALELGGKNAAVVLSDCDLQQAIATTAASVFYNCGQVCLCTERIYVAREVADAFVSGLKASAEAHVLGDPRAATTTLGPMVSHTHLSKVSACYERARDEGAEIIIGGGLAEMPEPFSQGAWIEPTIWMGLAEDSDTVRHEIFGPCCHIRVFDNEDEAVQLANDTPYGLAATVFSRDPQHAHSIAARLKAGVCWINGWMVRDLRTPFGGVGASGIGREGGIHAMEFHTELKNICALA